MSQYNADWDDFSRIAAYYSKLVFERTASWSAQFYRTGEVRKIDTEAFTPRR